MSCEQCAVPAKAVRRSKRRELVDAIHAGELTEQQRALVVDLLYRVDGMACDAAGSPSAVTMYAELLMETYAELLATVTR